MKTAAIALSVAALFASAAVSAQDVTPLTRAQVIAEYRAAVADGNGPLLGEQYPGSKVESASTLTRQQVAAELRVARERGEVLDGEQYPVVAADVGGEAKTRAQVRAEFAAYRVANPKLYDEYSL